jgi:DNA-binding FadR family transcriptional regulator
MGPQEQLEASSPVPKSQSIIMNEELPRRKTLTSQVFDYLLNLIVTEQIEPGKKLPTERELMQTLRVSRTCVREAMKSLESLKLVSVRPKIGSLVCEPSPATLLYAQLLATPTSDAYIAEWFEVRMLIEVGIVRMVADRASKANLLAIEEALDELRQSADTFSIVTADINFHTATARAARNAIASCILQVALTPLAEYRRKSDRLLGRKEVMLRQHSAIFLAIKQRNPEEAERAMYEHLVAAQEFWKLAPVLTS